LAAVSATEPRKLRQGRERYQQAEKRRRRREALARVKAYRAWLEAGSDLRRMPAVPTDSDFKLARGQR
jgi:hypothetical protein